MTEKRDSKFIVTAIVLFVALVGLAQAAPVAQEGADYIVQPGDTLASIGKRFLGDASLFERILSATNEKHALDGTYAQIDDPALLEVGWKLFVPGTGELPENSVNDGTPPHSSEDTVTESGDSSDIARGKIAFSLYNLAREVYEVQIVTAGGQQRWIVTDEESISEPALSPDGTRVAVRGWDRYRGIESFDLYGKNQAGVSGQFEDSKPDWAIDGTIVLGSQRESDRRWRLYENGSDTEWKFTNDDGMIESIVGEEPAWSPGADNVVYRGCDFSLNRCGLRTVERGGSRPRILTIESSDTSPDWSPDSAQILFMSKRRGNWDLYMIAVDGGGNLIAGAEPAPITADLSNEMLPVWSPWGDALAFISDRSGVWAVYIMRPDGSDLRKVADVGGTYDPPLWKPDYGGRGVTDEQISWSR